MRKTHLFIALNLVLSATACRKSDESKALVVQPKDLEGAWVGAVDDAEAPAYAFQFTDSQADIMTLGDGDLNCGGARPYHIVDKSRVAMEATEACKAAEFRITGIQANSISLVYDGVHVSLLRAGPVRLESFVSSSGAQEAELSSGFLPYLVAPQDDSAIDAIFAPHKAQYSGIQFKINKLLPDNLAPIVSTFTPEAQQYCLLVVAMDKAHEGEVAAIDDIQWIWPRDHDNIWHVRKSLSSLETSGMTREQAHARLLQWQAGIVTTKSARENRIILKSADARLILDCSRSLKKGIWTVDDVQEELKKMGGYVVLEKAQVQNTDEAQ